MLQMFRPVMPVAPKESNRKPPTRAPIIPSAMLSQKPWPSALTILLPIKPAIRPKYNPADNGHVPPPFELCLETIRHLSAALGKLCHDLLMQPDVHFRRAIKSASVAEFLRQLLAGAKAAVQFQQLHQVNDRPFPIIIFVLIVGEFRKNRVDVSFRDRFCSPRSSGCRR